MRTISATLCLVGLALIGAQARADHEKARIVIIAGHPSHGPGEHEFNAGGKLLVHLLKQAVPEADPVFVADGWPKDEHVFDDARTVVFFMDGGAGHPMIQGDHLKTIEKLTARGVGLVCLHYAVEFPKAEGPRLLDLLGGYYEPGYSDNPHNDAQLSPRQGHPITRGVKPFRANDEWYFKIRFRPEDPRVTSILTAEKLVGHDGKTYTDQVVAWATDRADGGRSFGFTGAHFHRNWGDPAFRKLVLNAIAWTAKLDVPDSGIQTEVSRDELSKNLDKKK